MNSSGGSSFSVLHPQREDAVDVQYTERTLDDIDRQLDYSSDDEQCCMLAPPSILDVGDMRTPIKVEDSDAEDDTFYDNVPYGLSSSADCPAILAGVSISTTTRFPIATFPRPVLPPGLHHINLLVSCQLDYSPALVPNSPALRSQDFQDGIDSKLALGGQRQACARDALRGHELADTAAASANARPTSKGGRPPRCRDGTAALYQSRLPLSLGTAPRSREVNASIFKKHMSHIQHAPSVGGIAHPLLGVRVAVLQRHEYVAMAREMWPKTMKEKIFVEKTATKNLAKYLCANAMTSDKTTSRNGIYTLTFNAAKYTKTACNAV